MMRFTVVWDQELDDAIANAWMSGDTAMRGTLTAISDWLDRHLVVDPDIKGRPGPEELERTIEVPLSVSSARVEAIYRVFSDDRLVRVRRLVFRVE
jgi:hypothetical protein